MRIVHSRPRYMVGLHAAGERELAREAEVPEVIDGDVGGREDVGHLEVAPGREARLSFGHLRLGARDGRRAPLGGGLPDGLDVPRRLALRR